MPHIPVKSDKPNTRESIHTCFWKRDSDGNFYVGCLDVRVQAIRQRDADYNFEKDFFFCPYCGGTLELT